MTFISTGWGDHVFLIPKLSSRHHVHRVPNISGTEGSFFAAFECILYYYIYIYYVIAALVVDKLIFASFLIIIYDYHHHHHHYGQCRRVNLLIISISLLSRYSCDVYALLRSHRMQRSAYNTHVWLPNMFFQRHLSPDYIINGAEFERDSKNFVRS